MRPFRAAFAAAFLSLAIALAGCGHGDRMKQVITAEESLAHAFNTGDVRQIYRLTAPDFAGVDTDGARYNREQSANIAVNFYRSGVRYTTNGIHVQVFGDTAIAQGYDHILKPDGTPLHGTSWTDTWVFRNGRWLLVSAADIPIAK